MQFSANFERSSRGGQFVVILKRPICNNFSKIAQKWHFWLVLFWRFTRSAKNLLIFSVSRVLGKSTWPTRKESTKFSNFLWNLQSAPPPPPPPRRSTHLPSFPAFKAKPPLSPRVYHTPNKDWNNTKNVTFINEIEIMKKFSDGTK